MEGTTTPAAMPSAVDVALAVATETEPAALSKRQQKKLAKRQHIEEVRREQKEQRKKQRTEHIQQKRSSIQEMLDGMTEEEREQWKAEQQAKREAREQERAAAKARIAQALAADLKIVIDLDFDGKMNDGEVKSLCQQLSYAYSACTHGEKQAHLHLLGLRGSILTTMQQKCSGYVNWAATNSEQTFDAFFKDRLGDLVYLTADSPNTLEELDTSKVYIIGGIVDRNRHKGICFDRAQEAGVATAKLPIGGYFKLQTSSVLTVNQVVDIMVKYASCRDWAAALQQVLPGRKVVEGPGATDATTEPTTADDAAADGPAAEAEAPGTEAAASEAEAA